MKKVINKYSISVFLFTLILSIISLTGLYFIKNYKEILSAFNINIKDNCAYKEKKLICEYVDISTKNTKIDIKNLSIEIYLKKIFTGEKFLFFSAENIDFETKLKKEKERKKENFNENTIKKILKYAAFLLYRAEINIKNLNADIRNTTYISVKNFSFENKNNKFYILKPFNISFNNTNIQFTDIEGKIDTEGNIIYIDSLKFNTLNTIFSLKGFYKKEGNGYLNGSISTKNYQFKDILISDLKTNFNIYLNSLKNLKYSINFNASSAKLQDYYLNNINGKSEGTYTENINGNLNINVKSILISNSKASSINLNSKYNINIKNLYITTESSLNIEKFENEEVKVPEIKSQFSLKYPKLDIKGSFTAQNIKGSFSFNENKVISVSTGMFNFSDILSFLKKYPKDLKEIKSKISIKTDIYTEDKNIISSVLFNNLDIFGIKFSSGFLNTNYNLINKKGNYDISLLSAGHSLNSSGEINNENIFANFNYKNINIKNLYFTKNHKIDTTVSGIGEISGSIRNPYIKAQGTADYFSYEDIKIKEKINYTINYHNFNININADTKKIKTAINIGIKPFFIDINAKVDKLKADPFYIYLKKLQPAIFNNLKPLNITGVLRVVVSDGYFVQLNIKDADVLVVPLENSFKANVNGYLSSPDNNLKIIFSKKDFNYKGFNINDIYGEGYLGKSEFLLSLNLKDSKNLDIFQFNGFLNLNLENDSIKSTTTLLSAKNGYVITANSSIDGTLSNFQGTVDYEVSLKSKNISKSKIDLNFHKNSIYNITLQSKEIPFNLENKIDFFIKNLKYDITVSENGEFSSYLSADTVNLNLSKLNLIQTRKILAKIDKKAFYLYQTNLSGVINGEINLNYQFDNENLTLNSKGKLNKQILSQIVQFVSIYGDINYELSYNGKLNQFVDNAYLKIYSDNLKIRSNYLIGYVDIKDLLGIYKSKEFKLSIKGKNSFITYGDNSISIQAKTNISPLKTEVSINTYMFPVKYSNIFTGNINSNLYIEYGKAKTVKGSIGISGQVNLSTSDFTSQSTSTSTENEELKEIKLDIDVNSFLPIYIYGNWGKAYAELKGKITGTAASPVFNGEINIIYGKITYLKNNYNIDFANIKIINNIPYINARISTVVANNYIFVNITGSPPNNLQFNFNSTPPRPKEEIMAMLLLRNTPGALENIPVFSVIGKLMISLFPVDKFLPGGEEGGGFLNTGFEVSISPKYSPTEGITASIYAKRNLTRRIFVAISSPINQTLQTTSSAGWYEAGIQLTERISILLKRYQDNTNELNIIFNLPFDF
jgi:hypothetical protein